MRFAIAVPVVVGEVTKAKCHGLPVAWVVTCLPTNGAGSALAIVFPPCRTTPGACFILGFAPCRDRNSVLVGRDWSSDVWSSDLHGWSPVCQRAVPGRLLPWSFLLVEPYRWPVSSWG